MSKDNSDFFAEKKPWSVYKDKLLGCYLVPYFQKIICSGRPLVYIDCFAGKGKFGDGAKGSPLIALECLNTVESRSRAPSHSVRTVFIELKYADDLKKNLIDCNFGTSKVISGRFEDHVSDIIQSTSDDNLFVYFDPYGIKALDMNIFLSMARKKAYRCSTELLINFNSFGLFRNCCKVMNIHVNEASLTGLAEYDTSSIESENGTTKIFGDDSWKSVVKDYREGIIDSYRGERSLTKLFCDRLKKGFQYVINMPIRASDDNNPKYRMIHATNNKEGCLLMAENMFKRSSDWRKVRNGGQENLFDLGVEDTPVNKEKIKDALFQSIPPISKHFNDILLDFYLANGIVASKATLVDFLKEFADSGLTEEERYPALTAKGAKRTFYEEKPRKERLMIRRIQ